MANIIGNNFNNVLVGTIFDDNISGLAGDDVLVGLAGNDFISGGTGADVMVGGTGNDTYVVDNFGDVVAEGFNEGIDRIFSSISLSLSAPGRFNVENLTLFGAAVTGAGNGLANGIAGNGLNNFLFGLGGNDTVSGFGGNDTIVGGFGRDVLAGGDGNDFFRYGSAAESPTGIFRDIIRDFDDFGNDTIDLSAVFGGVLAFRSTLPFTGAGQVRINDIAGPDVVVEVNLGGTLAPEMQIQLINTTAFSMTATDFFL